MPALKGGILITGASTGIGHDAALYLDSKGYTVFAGVRKQRDAESLLKERPSLRPVLLEVTDQESVDGALASIIESGVPLVALVNNAGVSRSAPVETHDLEEVKWLFDINVFGLMRVSRAFIPLLRQNKGRLINIGSVAGLVAQPFSGTYSGSKFAVEALTDAMRRELDQFDISVSIVEPGYVKTPINEKGTSTKTKTDAPEEVLALYAPAIQRRDDKRKKSFSEAYTTDCTNEAIADAILSKYPKTRYVVAGAGPFPAWAVARVAWLAPDRVQDILTLMFNK